jgi:hypothetical protein
MRPARIAGIARNTFHSLGHPFQQAPQSFRLFDADKVNV